MHRFWSRKRELLKRKYGVERHSQVRIVGLCRPPLRVARRILFLYGLLDSMRNDLPKYTEKEDNLYRRTAFLEIKANGKAFLEVWIWEESDWKALDLPLGMDAETIRQYLYDAGTEPWASVFVELSEQRTK